jgi:hypothetical protein
LTSRRRHLPNSVITSLNHIETRVRLNDAPEVHPDRAYHFRGIRLQALNFGSRRSSFHWIASLRDANPDEAKDNQVQRFH